MEKIYELEVLLRFIERVEKVIDHRLRELEAKIEELKPKKRRRWWQIR